MLTKTLRRHPFPVEAFFEHVLVLTYAYPAEVLVPMLPPGLRLDTWRGYGFLAIAMVQTRRLRPAGFPSWLGQDFFLSGYRIFARLTTASGRELRGLRILRSDTDRRLMVGLGNVLTDYHYHHARVAVARTDGNLEVEVRTPAGEADLHAVANLSLDSEQPPAGSPFSSPREARRFAGPLPFTFADGPHPGSVLIIEGVRTNWRPRLVSVQDVEANFLERNAALSRAQPVLASAFSMEKVPYRWDRGVLVPLASVELAAA
jgi:hypothetical protein